MDRSYSHQNLPYSPIQSEHVLSLRALQRPFWLDSNAEHHLAQMSFVSAAPSAILEVYVDRVVLFSNGVWQQKQQEPFVALEEFVTESIQLARCNTKAEQVVRPVCVGYLSYDLGSVSQRVSLPVHQDRPLLYMARYGAMYLQDKHNKHSSICGEGKAVQVLIDALNAPKSLSTIGPLQVQLDITQEEYQARFAKIKEHILDGDIYQANISLGLHTKFDGDPLALYQKLRNVARVPFGAYVEDGHGAILSASMERFLHGKKTPHGYQLETRPIKGTRPRKENPQEDLQQKNALASSEKDKAEHVMIVDLERNDLGRIATPGTVEVSELFSIYPHATVYHMESSVKAMSRPEVGIAEIFRAMFPTGSITGAPKKRAMQIIAETEKSPRGVYCGAIGYFDSEGGFDFSVAIRTAELRNGVLYYRAGGGLVSDSDPENEWQECNWKAAAFVKAISSL